MKSQNNYGNAVFSKSLGLSLLLLAFTSFVFLSPKWLFPLAAWTAPTAMLLFYRYAPFRRKYWWLLFTLIFAQLIAFDEVVPIPGSGLFVFVVLNALLSTLPYVLDKALIKFHQSFAGTLIFPLTCVAIEFIGSNGPWGVWNSVANTQFAFAWLIQLASVTGIWGISFMLNWFASTVAWLALKRKNQEAIPKLCFIYPAALIAVLVFGAIRYNKPVKSGNNTITVAGITVTSLPFLETLYRDVFHRTIILDQEMSPVSPELQLANQAMLPFIEQPDTLKFRNTLKCLSGIYDSLFALSKIAAERGAKTIEWSEGSAIMWKHNEEHFLERARNFAKENNVDMIVAIASIDTGKLSPGKKFMENKAVYIDRHGNVLNTLFKNRPVPGIEPTKPGDGTIPAIRTGIGIVSTSICYDADFPSLMQQLGKQRSGLLLLPSGDWKAIAPYHTNAAIIRAIENGCSIVRQVSGGLSVAADYRGKIWGSMDYFKTGDKIFVSEIPVLHIDTVYTSIGDSLAYLCLAGSTLCFVYLLLAKFKNALPNYTAKHDRALLMHKNLQD